MGNVKYCKRTWNKIIFKKIIKEIIPYIVILIVVVVIRTFIATPIKVDGTSMQPTLEGNEIMILNKLGKVERNNIKLF